MYVYMYVGMLERHWSFAFRNHACSWFRHWVVARFNNKRYNSKEFLWKKFLMNDKIYLTLYWCSDAVYEWQPSWLKLFSFTGSVRKRAALSYTIILFIFWWRAESRDLTLNYNK